MTRTKKVVLLTLSISLLAILSGCSDANGLRNIQKYHGKDAEVVMIPNSRGRFITRKKDGSIWYGFSSGLNEDSVSHVQILPPRKDTEITL